MGSRQPDCSQRWRSGTSTVRLGFGILAVSAMKCTPQNRMMSACVRCAACASCSESPTWSADLAARLLIEVSEEDGVALALELTDRVV